MLFFFSLVVNGVLAGAVYALIALAFVVVYKSSRMINFAVGEWVMFGSLLVATGLHLLAIDLAAAIVLACIGMIALAGLFGRLVLRHLAGRPLVSMIMITLGLGALMRGIAAIAFQGIPSAIPLPIPTEPLVIQNLVLPLDRLVAAGIASLCIAAVSWFYHASRTGLALRAIADSQVLASAMGINVQRHFTLTWAMAGMIAVVAGVLWTFTTGGGISASTGGSQGFSDRDHRRPRQHHRHHHWRHDRWADRKSDVWLCRRELCHDRIKSAADRGIAGAAARIVRQNA